MATRLLIVDDDAELTRLLTEFLQHEGFDVDVHPGGADAVLAATSGGYALVILDVMLPEISGLDILREIRRTSNTPIVLLTARGDDIDRIIGLEVGADDYVPKPFNPRELVARVRAILRRLSGQQHPPERPVLRVDDVTLDPAARTVFAIGRPIDLTTVEFDILRMLLQSAGETVGREAIAETVLGRRFDPFDRSIDVHISKVRRKLGPRAGGEERIKTIRNGGYIYTLTATRS